MRKIITVVGKGMRKSGVSKSGNAYDFTPHAITFEGDSRWDVGLRCAELNIGAQELQSSGHAGGLMVGDVVEVVMHEDFRLGGFVLDAIL